MPGDQVQDVIKQYISLEQVAFLQARCVYTVLLVI